MRDAKMDEKKLKFLTSSSTLFTWPLILCNYGDDLKSSAVKESVFSIRWYAQSKSINKLLQMVMIRAQQPVTIRAGKFYVATLETFSDLKISDTSENTCQEENEYDIMDIE
ncbi:hypothetical protein C0J52_13419 [Blattella germanica]|nr:hypothetical protein C0J52_13419 [Blattella germanica]